MIHLNLSDQVLEAQCPSAAFFVSTKYSGSPQHDLERLRAGAGNSCPWGTLHNCPHSWPGVIPPASPPAPDTPATAPVSVTVLPAHFPRQGSFYHDIVARNHSWQPTLIWFPGKQARKSIRGQFCPSGRREGFVFPLPPAQKMKSSGVDTLLWKRCGNTQVAVSPGPELRGKV